MHCTRLCLLCAALSNAPILLSARPQITMSANLSLECFIATTGLLSSPFAQCADASGFLAALDAKSGLANALSNWLNNFCRDTCSDDARTKAWSGLEGGCANELAREIALPSVLLGTGHLRTSATAVQPPFWFEKSVESDPILNADSTAVVANYDVLKRGACAESVSRQSYCFVEFVKDLEEANKRNFTMSVDLLSPTCAEMDAVPRSKLCTLCNQVLFGMMIKLLSRPIDRITLTDHARQTCGLAFASLSALQADVPLRPVGGRFDQAVARYTAAAIKDLDQYNSTPSTPPTSSAYSSRTFSRRSALDTAVKAVAPTAAATILLYGWVQ
ncbi:BZ3500_MvSof-1268-A1-R1_Chr2-1g04525 [Microbotryum saponariae]|uniref:BZ3500_MvSof-1268-A1-R1_Chr2-1g04525 protein n=1 Tax=Microbotryum saponariae TaxID=289078 RepID=A0A2X0KZU0_9BASI|nr:BZ3500_MvSof-1268-A1-R1_Chr2-1g04525 [Microbotryum saponariae]SCZ91921.1 BZ3501_MvSof-1269-A2-R1_Chr2-1g04181 [Microbotryum saponariae]